MAAAEMGQLGTVKVLLKNGADPCTTDKEGHTAEGSQRNTVTVKSWNMFHPDFIARKTST